MRRTQQNGHIEIFRDQGRYFHIERNYWYTKHNGVRDFKPYLHDYYCLTIVRANSAPFVYQGDYEDTKNYLNKMLKLKKKAKPKKWIQTDLFMTSS